MSASLSLYNGPSTLLKPQPEVMRNFLNWWFAGVEGRVEIAWVDPATKKLNQARHFDVRDPELEKFACAINSVEGQNCYFTPAIVSTVSGRASDKDFVCSAGFWLDQDTIQDINHGDMVEHPFRPSSFVYTGRTPEPRRQAWFKTEEPITDPNLVRETNRKLVGLYHGDPAVINPSRLMRMPGTISWPYKPGRTPELTSWDHSPENRRTAHPVALVASLPAIAKPELIEQRVTNRVTVSDLVQRIQANEYWHNNMVRLVAHWVSRGMSDQEILVWAADLTREGYDISQTEDEIQEAIGSARVKWNVPSVDRPATTRLEDAQAAFAEAPALPIETDDSLFELLSLETLTERHGKMPDMLIDGFLTRGSTTMITGLPGTGKSPMAQHMVVCVALGVPWAGIPTKQGRSIYIAAESHAQTAMNLASLAGQELEKEWGCPIATPGQLVKHVGQKILTLTSAFLIETDTEKLIKTIEKELSPGGRWMGLDGPDIVVYDTLRAMSSGSVNDDADMVAVQAQIAAMKRRFTGMCSLLLNHSPKGDPEGSLGSNRLEAFSEIIVNVTHKKPHANADDDAILKRPQRIGPDADGWTISPLAITVQRNKTWTPPLPMRASLLIKESTLQIAYGADSLAKERPMEGEVIEDTPFKPKSRAVKSSLVKVPDHLKKASDSAINKRDWVQKILEASNIEMEASDLASIAFSIDSLLFMGAPSISSIGEILSELAKEGKIDRGGTGRGSHYARKGLST